MKSVFNHTFTDSFGDNWDGAVVVARDIEYFQAIGRKLTLQQNLNYSVSQSGISGDTPNSAIYSVVFWSNEELQAQGYKHREFTKDGEQVFEIDFSDGSVAEKWAELQGEPDDKVIQLVQWHFKEKVTG